MRGVSNKEPAIFSVVMKSLLVSYVMTGVLLFVLALFVFKTNISQSVVELMILAIYIITSLAGGFIAGKMGKTRKFIWGAGVGAAYVLVLIVVSCALNGGMDGGFSTGLITFVMCAGAGMLGGMVS